MSRKKKLLLLTSRLPYPLVGGDRIKNYHLIKILSKYFDIYLVSITNESIDKKGLDFLEKYTFHYKIFKKSKLDMILSTFKTFFNNKPLQVNYYYFNDIKKYINNLSKDMDLIIPTLVRTAEYAINLDVPKIFDMADSLGLNYKKSVTQTKSLFWKIIFSFEYKRLLNYEKKCIDSYDFTSMFNKGEIKHFKSNKVFFLPYSANNDTLLNYSNINTKYNNFVCFFGKMNYQPNIDATLWFVESVLQGVNKDLTFVIVGAHPTAKIKRLESKYSNLMVTGFLDDPYIILNSCLCVTSPMKTGGGIQGKILETMALGTINIISSKAALPIGAVNGMDYIVEDDPGKIALKINDIYENNQFYNDYKINSKEFIQKNFTWNMYEEILLSKINTLLND
jgi:glycosyltransferase involved in cell wall biosynthesis